MKVYLQLLSYLRDFLPPGTERGRITLELPDGARLSGMFDHLDLQDSPGQGLDKEKFFSAWELSLNGEFVTDLDRDLHDGDQVIVFPNIAGG
jgi:molybdopterin converting factor small subunit